MLEFSSPGKVFLAGEYLALLGGPALVAAINPQFRLTAKQNNKKNENPFHPNSIAGKFWILHRSVFEKYEITFLDPHHGAGGFGGSTAEYLLLGKLLSQHTGYQSHVLETLQQYRELARGDGALPRGYTPSGADLVAQIQGGLTLFSAEQGKIEKYKWPFSDLGFYVGKTQEKLRTHEHLSRLQSFEAQGLSSSMKDLEDSLQKGLSHAFVKALQQFSNELLNLGFVSEGTQAILKELTHPGILVKKGCGAMGADVVLVVYDKQGKNADIIKMIMEEKGLKVVATEESLI